MNKRIHILIICLFALVLTACSNSNGKDNNNNETGGDIPEIIDVELHVQETADVNEAVALSSTVTQGDEKVTDADKVVFEVWEEGTKNPGETGEMIEAKNNNDGTYEAEKIFDHDGLFHIQVHVDARGMHAMPKSSITVGEGGHYEVDEHHEHAEGFSMHFMKPENAEKNKELELMVHVSDDASPLENAKVRYEIWNEDLSDKHDWVDTEESSPGEYSAIYSFEEAGTYSIQIHVENDDGLHEHDEYEIEVK